MLRLSALHDSAGWTVFRQRPSGAPMAIAVRAIRSACVSQRTCADLQGRRISSA